MALSKEYLDYLDDHIEMAPANSQEELDAAQTLLGLFSDHGLESALEDLAAPPDTRLIRGILMVVMFIGAIIAGIGGVGLAVLGLFLFLVGFVLVNLGLRGNDLMARFMESARSQNVVAVHRGEGPESGRGVRPIVVLAHYDTGREDLLSNPAVSRHAHFVYQLFPITSLVSLVCAFLQIVQVIPEPVLRVLWVIAILCTLPALAWGVNDIASRFMPPTGAANDNNSSLAALLGVMEDVAPANPSYLEPHVVEEPVREVVAPSEPTGELVEHVTVEEEPRATRHGAEVIRAMGILSPSCEITYVEAPAATVRTATAVTTSVTPDDLRPSVGEPTPRSARRVTETVVEERPASAAENPVVETEVAEATGELTLPDLDGQDATGEIAVERETVTAAGSTADLGVQATGPMAPAVEGDGDGDGGSTVAMAMIGPDDTGDPVADPNWGISTYTPGDAADVARRAALFDLPDPSVAAVDPLSSTFDTGPSMAVDPADFPEEDFDSEALYETQAAVQPSAAKGMPVVRAIETRSYTRATDRNGRVTVRGTQHTRVTTARGTGRQAPSIKVQPLEVSDVSATGTTPTTAPAPAPTAEDGAKAHQHRSLRDRLHIPGRKRPQDESMSQWLGVDEDFDARRDGESIGSWDNFDDDEWKGGATRSAETRTEDQGQDGELADAVLSMADEKLLAHDIWFVAAGASELDHAGARAFLESHRKELRGAFLVNLSCIGAGELTVLTAEGVASPRRVDRRILKMLTRIAKDLHVPLRECPMTWAESDATAAMRNSVRSATLVGLDPGDMPALSHTAQNVIQNVDDEQVADVNRIVTELIRRS